MPLPRDQKNRYGFQDAAPFNRCFASVMATREVSQVIQRRPHGSASGAGRDRPLHMMAMPRLYDRVCRIVLVSAC
jgi:hypothetical protein